MKILSLEFTNWQCYAGDSNKFDFSGPQSTNNSAIILGRNGQGKSAFFEGLRFLLYGNEVITDRDSAERTKPIRPLVGKEKKTGPLMCVEAYIAGERRFGVSAKFEHEGKEYEIERSYESNKKMGDANSFKPTFYIMDSRKKKEPSPEQFIDRIIPQKIAKFFLLDGEVIQEYRLLFSQKRPGLSHDIENILRLDLLSRGMSSLMSIKSELSKQKRKLLGVVEGEGANSERARWLTAELEADEEDKEKMERRIDELEKLKEEAWEICLKHGSTSLHAKAIEDADDEIINHKRDIEGYEKRRHSHFNKSWKILIKPVVDETIAKRQQVVKRQRSQDEKASVIKNNIDNYNNMIDDQPCDSCNRTTLLSPKEKEGYLAKISVLEKEMLQLRKDSQAPDTAALHQQIIRLKGLETDSSFESVHALNTDISKKRERIRELKEHIASINENMTAKALREAKKAKDEHDEYTAELDDCGTSLGIIKRRIEGYESELSTLTQKRKSGKSQKDVDAIDRQISIAVMLNGLAARAKAPFRDVTRTEVRGVAEPIYTTIIDENHDELLIDTEFRIEINEKGKSVRPSSGQYALAAYAILDALSRVSNVEFPFIVDTPGRSIDKEYLKGTFQYVLENSNRQVILLPTTAEIEKETMVNDYGSEVSSIYVIDKKKKDSTTIEELHRRR